jgi:hypothetical protein
MCTSPSPAGCWLEVGKGRGSLREGSPGAGPAVITLLGLDTLGFDSMESGSSIGPILECCLGVIAGFGCCSVERRS